MVDRIEKFFRCRNQRLNVLISKAEENDVHSIVQLLKRPDYARLLTPAKLDLSGEEFYRSPRFHSADKTLLEALITRVYQKDSIPTWLPLLIRLMVTALPHVLYPPPPSTLPRQSKRSIYERTWMHPLNYLRIHDSSYLQCREAMLGNIRWSPDIHSLLPDEVQATYVLLARILWKYGIVGMDHVFKMICSYLPPAIENKSSSHISLKTPLEIAHDLDFKVTFEFWRGLMTVDPRPTNIHVGKTGYRFNGYSKYDSERLFANHIQNRLIYVQNEWELRALGLSSSCNVAMTNSEYQSLLSTATNEDPIHDGRYGHWFNFSHFFLHNNRYISYIDWF